MKALCLLTFIFASSLHAADQAWVKENCPRCYQTSDGNYLFKVDQRIVKFSPRSFRNEQKNIDFIAIDWIGIANPHGETAQQDVTFSTQVEREKFESKYKRVCKLFSGFTPFSSELAFSQGDQLTDPLVSTTVTVKITCMKKAIAPKPPEVADSVGDLVNFLSGSEPKKKVNLGVYDESRGEEARNPRGAAERLPASTTGVSGQ